RVGHSFIKQIMRDQGGLFAGELSCHFYFSDFFCCESGIFAMLELLQIVADAGRTLRALVQPLRKYAQSGEINFPVVDQRLVMDKVEKQFANGRITYLDGISVDYEDWWFNLRASNTEPLLRLNLEAKTEELMEEKLAEVSKLFEPSK
ncbi:phosphomannomutase/phosphoglucomutase, partial [archaeon]